MNEQGTFDVCIVGGGPAGAAAAQVLARLGRRVIVIESSEFPRQHVGESLPASIWPLLAELQVDRKVASEPNGHYSGSWVQWGSPLQHRSFTAMGRSGMQVDRGQFDAILLNQARLAGALVCQPGFALPPVKLSGDVWSIQVKQPERVVAFRARHIVDASGRRGWIRVARDRDCISSFALHAHWKSETADHETRIEAGSDYWLWAAPLGNARTSIAVFVDRSALRHQRAAGDSSRHSLIAESLHDEIVRASSLLRRNVVSFRLQPVQCCESTPYFVRDAAGSDWTMIGDSSMAIDPLSSQGVQAAIASGLRGAAVVNTCLLRPENAAMAVELHNSRIRESFFRHKHWASEVYSQAAPSFPGSFWDARSAAIRDSHDDQYASNELPQTVNDSSLVPQNPLTPESRLRLARTCRLKKVSVLRNYLVESLEAVIPEHGRDLSHSSAMWNWLRSPVAYQKAMTVCRT